MSNIGGNFRYGQQGGGRRPVSDPLEILARFKEPMLRMSDVPGADLLAGQLMVNPADQALVDLWQHVERQQLEQAVMAGDPFWPNYPPVGSLPPLCPGRISICLLPTGNVLSITAGDLCKNLLLVGPTGGGKTNSMKIILASILEDGRRPGLVIAFDRKGRELVDAAYFASRGFPLLMLYWSELAIAMRRNSKKMSVSNAADR